MKQKLAHLVFDYLLRLEKNNNREWFNKNKQEFKEIESVIKQFYNELFERIREYDDIDDLKVFRIYRDIRFSKNKTPYKIYFSGSFHRKKPKLRGGYYLHLQPNNESFMAAGFWNPNKDDLFRIRKELELDASEIIQIMNSKNFKTIWGDLVGDQVKTAPRGFNKSHKNIDLIKKKMYIFKRPLSDKEITSDNITEIISQDFKLIRPFFNYMSDVLTTNLNGESLI